MPNEYVSLDAVRRYMSLASQNTSNDEEVLRMIRQASRSIDRYTRRKFYPRRETQFYDYAESQRIKLNDDLLELESLYTQNGASLVGAGVLWLGTGDDWNQPPYERIVLDDSAGCVLNFSGTKRRANHVTGFWGYHEAWSEAWVDTGTSLAVSAGASATTLTLAGAGSAGVGASDIFGDAPRVSIGNTLRVGDEFYSVIGGDSSGGVLVRPFANGTVSASHASGASVARYAPEPDVTAAALRLTVWSFGQKDTPYQNRVGNTFTGDFMVPQSWPPDVRDKIDRLVRRAYAVIPK